MNDLERYKAQRRFGDAAAVYREQVLETLEALRARRMDGETALLVWRLIDDAASMALALVDERGGKA